MNRLIRAYVIQLTISIQSVNWLRGIITMKTNWMLPPSGKSTCSAMFIEPLEDRIAPATIYVNSLADHEQTGKITLRDAINMANAATSPAIIDFGTPAKALKGTITLKSPLPQITYSVTINGTGVTISGANKFQDISIGSAPDVTLNGLKITAGHSAIGAGVYISDTGGTITINKCVITANHAVGAKGASQSAGYAAQGGGIADMGGALTITNSTISKNTAAGGAGGAGGQAGGSAQGGGIFTTDSLTITSSTISGNTATGGAGGAAYNASYSAATQTTVYATAGGAGGAAQGGGIFNSGAYVTVTASTVSGNAVKGGIGAAGGKPLAGYNGADFSVSQGMVNAPTGGGDGGDGQAGGAGGNANGAGIASTGGTSKISTSTISGNIATAGAGGAGSNGGHGGAGGKGGHSGMYSYTTAYGGSGGAGGYGGNSGIASGGGVYSNDTLTISSSTISGNTVIHAKAGAAGAGGAKGSGTGTPTDGAAGMDGTLYMGAGGGIHSNAGSVSLSLVTIAANSADNGGGVSLYQPTSAEIHNSTIAFNKAASGGGMFVTPDSSNDPINVISTIVAQNSAATNADVDATTITAANSLIGVSAILGKLGFHDHNKLTETLLPSASGPAVTGGSNPDGLTADQNGQPFGSTIFIGAVQTTT